ncbi:MAG: methyl-accepting chemotaxis protein [Anaerolineae bacterium]|nr:methyl-accepting chemotaxis protein [Anaerolineae bacterium]
MLAGQRGVDEYQNYQNKPVVGAFVPIEQMGWGLLVEEEQKETFTAVTRLRSIILLVVLVMGLLVASLAFLIARNITRPIVAVTEAARKLAVEDVYQTISIKSRDETGVMAAAFQQIITYLQGMVAAAECLAHGDLTADVTPQSGQDALGHTFHQMITNLRHLVAQVKNNAADVATASDQLAAVADQAGLATAQIADITQQVAHGTAQQAEAVTKTTTSVEQMTRALDGVA